MKKIIAIILALMMLLSFAACGDAEDTAIDTIGGQDGPTVSATAEPEKTPEPTPEPVETTPEPNSVVEETPEPEFVEEPTEGSDMKATAESFIGASLDELIAAIGEPESSDYAPSCLGEGEDGNLYYDGFVVYTYRENGTETVEYVE